MKNILIVILIMSVTLTAGTLSLEIDNIFNKISTDHRKESNGIFIPKAPKAYSHSLEMPGSGQSLYYFLKGSPKTTSNEAEKALTELIEKKHKVLPSLSQRAIVYFNDKEYHKCYKDLQKGLILIRLEEDKNPITKQDFYYSTAVLFVTVIENFKEDLSKEEIETLKKSISSIYEFLEETGIGEKTWGDQMNVLEKEIKSLT